MKKIKVAAVQMKVTDYVEENIKEILYYIEKAAEENADFVCFPELSLISDEERIRSISKEVKQIKELANKKRINVIFGSYVNDEGFIKNQIWVVNKKGETIHKYSKRNPYLTEKAFLKAGRRNRVLELDGVKFAVINCWDYAFPEHIRKLSQEGAQIIFCPSYLIGHPRTKHVLDKIPQVRAFDAMSYFLMVDAHAPETYKKTRICHPLRELAFIENDSGMICADLNLKEIDALRNLYDNFK